MRPFLPLLLCLALGAAGCGGDDEPPAPSTGGAQAPRDVFASTCGSCHVLADANTGGSFGPNLDELAPDENQVLRAIQTGPGNMPADLLSGENARSVAKYVAENAGR